MTLVTGLVIGVVVCAVALIWVGYSHKNLVKKVNEIIKEKTK